MATYYVELQGGALRPSAQFCGGDIYPGGGGGGGATLQTRSVSYTPTESAISASVTPDPGYDGMDQVNVSVGAISSTYVGSGVARNDSTDLTASGATVTAPAGYYENAATKTIPSVSSADMYGELNSINSSGDVVFDVDINASGYVSSGTVQFTDTGAVTVRTSSDLTASGATVTAPSGYYLGSASKTIPNATTPWPSYSWINNDGTISTDIEINTDGYITHGTYTETTENPMCYTQAAQTIYPSTSDQTIAADTYLLGAQTIKGVTTTNLTAANIKKDVVVEVGDSSDPDRIVSVTGTYEGGGGGDQNPTAKPKDVNFIDYDGTIRYSYSNAEIALLSALPPNPTHNRLTAQGWNWDLADIKTQMQKMPKQPLFVGQQYVTTSGNTEIDIALTTFLKIYVGISVNGSANIDWGDGSAQDTITGTSVTSQIRKDHTYAEPGYYTISIITAVGDIARLYGTNGYTVVNGNYSNETANQPYQAVVRAVRFGGQRMGDYALARLSHCEYVTTNADNYANIGGYTFNANTGIRAYIVAKNRASGSTNLFYGATTIRYVSLPKECITFGQNTFNSCGIETLCIPYGATTIGSGSFNNCNRIREWYIPETITSINGNAFNGCTAAMEYHFMATAPPTLSSSTGFTSKHADCRFYVPYSADHSVLSAYQTASNWSTFASIMLEETP